MSDTAQDEWFNPPGVDGESAEWANYRTEGQEGLDFTSLFDAPDFSTFVKLPKTATAREYETRVKAAMKAAMLNALSKGNLPDAATFIYHGPGFASASGFLADADDHAKKLIDLISSPSNPYVLFFLTVAPMVAQLLRNHEGTLQQLPDMRRQARAQRKAQRKAESTAAPRFSFRLPFLRRVFSVPIRFHMGRSFFRGFRAQTHDPGSLVMEVFSNQKLITELNKQGIFIRQTQR